MLSKNESNGLLMAITVYRKTDSESQEKSRDYCTALAPQDS